ncbi:craniofacial development protein 2-like [Tachysurus ichikawai]
MSNLSRRTILRPGAATLLSRELCRYNISLAGLCEVRWHGNGEITAGDHCYFWSGPERRTGLYGVALTIPKDPWKSLISWTPLSDRLLSARFLHQHGKMTVIVTYAPTNVSDEDAKDAFFDQLHQAVGLASPHDITIILTDTNATLSISDRSTGSPVGTTFADRFTNDNGNRLLLLCHYNNLCVADTWFPRKLIRYWTWYSPDDRTRKALDHILISRCWKPVVTNCLLCTEEQSLATQTIACWWPISS